MSWVRHKTTLLDVASSNVSPPSDAQNEQTQLSHPALIREKLMNSNDVNMEEVIKECTCDGPRGKTGCPVHDMQKKQQAENYDSWQIEMMHWGVHY